MLDVEVTVIGGGVVGCAVAAEAARRGLDTVLLEKEPRLAGGVTARNSEVAHGGMYYPAGTLKARFCVRGRRLLREFCADAGVEYQEKSSEDPDVMKGLVTLLKNAGLTSPMLPVLEFDDGSVVSNDMGLYKELKHREIL